MLTPLTAANIADYTAACAYERVFGSKALTALRAYGLTDAHARFFLLREGQTPTAALYLAGDVLAVSACETAAPAPIAALAQQYAVHEIDVCLPVCLALQQILGGTVDSSCYMVCPNEPTDGPTAALSPGALPAVFSVLQQSHEYYRTHLRYQSWADDLSRRLSLGLSELYQLTLDGQAVGTGTIASEDDECGIIAAVAVIPAYRGRGLGEQISRALAQRIRQKGKTPRLIAGYDSVAALYRRIGFVPCGRWGELYL